MGYALAERLAIYNAKIILISGPTAQYAESSNIRIIRVTSAEDMYEACLTHFPECDGAILAAAVADYKPIKASQQKIKSSAKNLTIELEPNSARAYDGLAQPTTNLKMPEKN